MHWCSYNYNTACTFVKHISTLVPYKSEKLTCSLVYNKHDVFTYNYVLLKGSATRKNHLGDLKIFISFNKVFKISKEDFKILIKISKEDLLYLSYLGLARDFNIRKYMMKINKFLLVKDFRFQYSLRFLKISRRFHWRPTRFHACCGP